MLLESQFAREDLSGVSKAVSEQCGQTCQHAATQPKVNIESQGLGQHHSQTIDPVMTDGLIVLQTNSCREKAMV